MREITYDQIVSAVRSLCITANTVLPADLCQAIRTAREEEVSPVGQAILGDLEENFTFAAQRGLPICQDTGMAVVFLALGQEAHITGGLLEDAVNEGVRRGYLEGALRCSVVRDPLRRENTGDNTPAVQYLRLTEGDQLTITVRENGLEGQVVPVLADLTDLSALPEGQSFDVVTCNPPYKIEGRGILSETNSDQIARHETACTIDDVCRAAAWLLKFGGRFCVCQRPERLPDVMEAMRRMLRMLAPLM